MSTILIANWYCPKCQKYVATDDVSNDGRHSECGCAIKRMMSRWRLSRHAILPISHEQEPA